MYQNQRFLAFISTNIIIYTVFAQLNTSLIGLISTIVNFVVFPYNISFDTLNCFGDLP